jgi:flagellar FliL protein
VADAAAEAKPEAPRGKTSKLVPLLLILNLGASGAAAFFASKAGAAATKAHAPAPAAPEPAELALPTGPTVVVDPFVVNLNEPGSSRYLKATFELELATPKAATALEKGKRAVRDDVLRYLSGLKVDDTLGEDNKAKIQQTLVARIDKLLGEGQVRRLYFNEFVVQ